MRDKIKKKSNVLIPKHPILFARLDFFNQLQDPQSMVGFLNSFML